MKVPKAAPVLTPAQYGAVAPDPDPWPLNAWTPDHALYSLQTMYPAVQGEGRQAGTPMTIVRLQGCPVACNFCDTPETWARPGVHGQAIHAAVLAERVAATGLHWALVTGGEPCWHDLCALTEALHRAGVKAALETSGVFPLTGSWDWITVSPKPQGRLPFSNATLEADEELELKWIVGKAADVAALEAFLVERGLPRRGPNWLRISLQPMSTSTKATELCLEALMTHPDWFLSLQTHKLIGVA